MERQPRDPRIEPYIEAGGIPIPGIEWDGRPDPLPLNPDDWFPWYARQLVRRLELQERCRASEEARNAARLLCMQRGGIGHLYWLCMFGFIDEPRIEEGKLPFIPGPAQAELILLMDAVMQTPKGAKSSLVGEKSREVGMTWLDASHHVWMWQFLPSYTGLIASFTEDKVDKRGDSSSYFWKLIYLVEEQPEWLKPRGWRPDKPHRTHMMMINPETKAAISGTAAVQDIGRSGRYRKISFDEANFNPYFESGWNGSNNATDHRFAFSTASKKHHKAFHDLVRGIGGYKTSQPTVFIFHWWMFQGRDNAWLEAQKSSMSESAFKMEVLMDYRADGGSYVYPMFERHDVRPLQPNPMFPKYIGIDDGYTDACAMVGFQVDPVTANVDVLWAYQNYGKTIHFYGHLLKGEPHSLQDWTDYDLRFMTWLQRHHLTEATYFGDRHGEDTNMVTGTSPFAELTKHFGIHVVTNYDPARNTYLFRQEKVGQMASRMRFNDDWGAPSALVALRESRFPEMKENSNLVSPAKKPIHDSNSHLRTAVEYWAGNYSFNMFESGAEDAMILPSNPIDRMAQQYGNAYKRKRSEQVLYEEALPPWNR